MDCDPNENEARPCLCTMIMPGNEIEILIHAVVTEDIIILTSCFRK